VTETCPPKRGSSLLYVHLLQLVGVWSSISLLIFLEVAQSFTSALTPLVLPLRKSPVVAKSIHQITDLAPPA